MSLYFRELNSSFKTMIIWIASLGGATSFMMSIYPTFADKEEEFDELMAGFPPEVLRAFGLSDINFGNLLQFFGYILSFIFLVVAIFSINLGGNSLSKEEVDRTSEFLLTKPITRFQIVSFKILATLTNVLILNLAFFIISIVIMESVKKAAYNSQTLFIYFIAMLLFQLLFMSIGFILSVSTKNSKKVPPLALGIVFGLYGLSLISGIFNDKPWITYLTPFKYFDTFKIAREGTLQIHFIVLSLVIICFCISLTYYKYTRRDISA